MSARLSGLSVVQVQLQAAHRKPHKHGHRLGKSDEALHQLDGDLLRPDPRPRVQDVGGPRCGARSEDSLHRLREECPGGPQRPQPLATPSWHAGVAESAWSQPDSLPPTPSLPRRSGLRPPATTSLPTSPTSGRRAGPQAPAQVGLLRLAYHSLLNLAPRAPRAPRRSPPRQHASRGHWEPKEACGLPELDSEDSSRDSSRDSRDSRNSRRCSEETIRTTSRRSSRAQTRVFKKSSQTGRITVYLGKRDFVDHITHVDPIDGVVLIDKDYAKDRKVFGHVIAAFRYGREDLDVLGLTFRKDLYLASAQIYPKPPEAEERPLTRLQERLLRKLGPHAYPFYFELPPYCPASVTLQPAPGDSGKPCGVDYELTVFIGKGKDDKPHKKNMVQLAIRKVMYAPSKQGEQPSVEVSKEFMMSPHKLHLEASLDKELYHHGETIAVNVYVANNSNRTVKKIKVSVKQFADICLFSTAQYKCTVAEIESEAGCPVGPGFTLSKVYQVKPLLANNKTKRGLALDGQLKDEDTNLASSTMEGCPIGPGFTLSIIYNLTPLLANNKNNWGLALDGQLRHEDTNLASSTLVVDPSQKENLGIIVQYKVKVKLSLGTLGGDLVAELPFTLMHPKPDDENDNSHDKPPCGSPSHNQAQANGNAEGNNVPVDNNLIQLDTEGPEPLEDQDDDIIFEDFARLRLKAGETDA